MDHAFALLTEMRTARVASEYREDMAPPGMLHGILAPEKLRPFSAFKAYPGKARGLVFVARNGSGPLFRDGVSKPERHRATLEAAWGAEVAWRAVAAVAAENRDESDGCATCADLGIVSHCEYAHQAVQELVMCGEFGMLQRVSDTGIWLRIGRPTGVRDLVRLVRDMARELGHPPPDEEASFEFFRVYRVGPAAGPHRFLLVVADADWRYGGERLARVRATWEALSEAERELVRRGLGDEMSVVSTLMTAKDFEKLDAGLAGLAVAALPAARG
jgi:hypothetical protein